VRELKLEMDEWSETGAFDEPEARDSCVCQRRGEPDKGGPDENATLTAVSGRATTLDSGYLCTTLLGVTILDYWQL
jgi:hypothetical protein